MKKHSVEDWVDDLPLPIRCGEPQSNVRGKSLHGQRVKIINRGGNCALYCGDFGWAWHNLAICYL